MNFYMLHLHINFNIKWGLNEYLLNLELPRKWLHMYDFIYIYEISTNNR